MQKNPIASRLSVLLAPALMLAAETTLAAAVLWGYGVKSCESFLDAAPPASAPAAIASEDYVRFREWLSGLVSGLNLASGSDVLGGAELDAAMSRVRARCKKEPNLDFFNASIDEIKKMSQH